MASDPLSPHPFPSTLQRGEPFAPRGGREWLLWLGAIGAVLAVLGGCWLVGLAIEWWVGV